MMNRIESFVCSHPHLRAVDYDETYHWVVSCPDCGHLGSMTQADWRAWQRAHRPVVRTSGRHGLEVKDEGAETARIVLPRSML